MNKLSYIQFSNHTHVREIIYCHIKPFNSKLIEMKPTLIFYKNIISSFVVGIYIGQLIKQAEYISDLSISTGHPIKKR